MSRGLDFEIDLRFVETVREADGLAMSSRNRYLSSEEREKAPHIYQQLLQLREDLRSEGHRPRDLLEQAAISLKEVGFRVDYLALVDSRTLEPTETIAGDSRLIVAAWIGRTRLIDNCAVYPSVMP
jgi:pantoate--beta-alanine ligase